MFTIQKCVISKINNTVHLYTYYVQPIFPLQNSHQAVLAPFLQTHMHTYGCITLPAYDHNTHTHKYSKVRTINTKISRGKTRNYKTLQGLAGYPSM